MTDYERTTTRETTTVDPAAPGYTEPATQAATVQTTERSYVAPGPSGVTTASRVVTFLFGILQAALILRIILLLLVANPDNDVVALILNITDPFVEPFRGMFSIDRVTIGDSIGTSSSRPRRSIRPVMRSRPKLRSRSSCSDR